MGIRYGQRRQRGESLKNPGDIIMSAIGENDINVSHYDEKVVADVINAKIDVQEEKLRTRTQTFVR